VTGQLESRHFFRMRDTVQHFDGTPGMVVDAQTLYATVVWDDGRREEIDQFDPRVEVIQRATSE
jgi:hypothetical protein